jgi:hypothetical protein
MSKNVCSIYKYTVGMLYAEGREKAKKATLQTKKKKACIIQKRLHMSNADQNHQSCENGKKKGKED